MAHPVIYGTQLPQGHRAGKTASIKGILDNFQNGEAWTIHIKLWDDTTIEIAYLKDESTDTCLCGDLCTLRHTGALADSVLPKHQEGQKHFIPVASIKYFWIEEIQDDPKTTQRTL